MNAHVTALARTLLGTTATAIKHSLREHCKAEPRMLDGGDTVLRANLVSMLTSCSTEQAVLESAYVSDHMSGADAVKETNTFGWGPLHHAVALGDQGAVLDLLNHGADIHLATHAGMTPLHIAVVWGATHLVPTLLRSGAALSAPDAWGRTPLRLWCTRGWDVGPASEYVDCDALRGASLGASRRPSSNSRTPRPTLNQAGGVAGEATRVTWDTVVSSAEEPAAQATSPHGSTARERQPSPLWFPSADHSITTRCGISEAPATLSPTEFVRDFLSIHKPVVIRGALFESEAWKETAHRLSRFVWPRVGV